MEDPDLPPLRPPLVEAAVAVEVEAWVVEEAVVEAEAWVVVEAVVVPAAGVEVEAEVVAEAVVIGVEGNSFTFYIIENKQKIFVVNLLVVKIFIEEGET